MEAQEHFLIFPHNSSLPLLHPIHLLIKHCVISPNYRLLWYIRGLTKFLQHLYFVAWISTLCGSGRTRRRHYLKGPVRYVHMTSSSCPEHGKEAFKENTGGNMYRRLCVCVSTKEKHHLEHCAISTFLTQLLLCRGIECPNHQWYDEICLLRLTVDWSHQI